MEKKYELDLSDSIEIEGHKLYRIIAVRTFSSVVIKESKGGYIESEDNLSHEDSCWVDKTAVVYGESKISGRCTIYNSTICDSNIDSDSDILHSKVYHSRIHNSSISHASIVETGIFNTEVENAHIEHSEIDKCYIYTSSTIKNCVLYNCHIDDCVMIENTTLYNTKVISDAKIHSMEDIIVFKNHFSSGRYFTWTKSNDMWTVGCFYGTGKELIKKAYEDDERKGKFYEAYVNFVESIKNL